MNQAEMDAKTDAWHQGRYDRRNGETECMYPEGSTKHAEWLEGFQYVDVPLKLEDITQIAEVGQEAPYTLYGYVIDKDARIYGLVYQWYHGLICALLYPELAAAHECGIPVEPRGENNVFKYQNFEHNCAEQMDVIRIAVSVMTGVTHFSRSFEAKPSEAQLASVLACCRALGYKGRDKINTEGGDRTVAQIIEVLRTGDSMYLPAKTTPVSKKTKLSDEKWD